MARKGASGARRIELNRAAMEAIDLAVADGMFELAKAIVTEAKVPDGPPYGEGLREGGGVLAFYGSKRIGVATTGGQTSVRKPRAARLAKGRITVIGGYGFPGRFLEEGTVKTRAQPFLTPATMDALPDAEGFVRDACVRRRIVSAERSARGDTFAARRAAREATA